MRIAGILALLVLLGGCAAADPGETHDVYFHSDLPLMLRHDQPGWPRYCSSPDPSIIADGVCSPFLFGDWKLVRTACKYGRCESFMRLGDIGFVYGFDEADYRSELVGRGVASFIFKLEADDASTLYALQVGYQGGSRYILLSATPDADGDFTQMTVLDAHCLKLADVRWRRPGPEDEDADEEAYCAVNSMAALIAIAREAQSRPPAATMTYLGPVPDDRDR